MLFARRYPSFRNFDSTISIDVIRMKSYITDSLFNPQGGFSGFLVTGMKKPKKIPRASDGFDVRCLVRSYRHLTISRFTE